MTRAAACRHEGAGSVDALLKARGWATELGAGEGGGSFSARSFFCVSIALSDAGACLRACSAHHVHGVLL
jgi:secreted Zn-dependent insulinase-like peptidase